jgi:tripartite ATP-independent transporter DctM subunit
MIDLSPETVTVVMMAGLLIAVMFGHYLALVIGALALVVGYLTLGEAVFQILYQKAYGLALNYTFAAVPMFIFMGCILERTGIASRLYDAFYLWLGGLRGGLAIVTVLIGTVMAACVGIISASVTMLALVALPSMIRRGYDKGLASGACAAGGTLGILIPPSIMLVVYGPMAQVSVGKLFMGAFFPGLTLSFLYCSYIAVRCYLQPQMGPAVPAEERTVPFIKKTAVLATSLIPPMILILSVLGVIFFGIAPPTEAAAIGATTSVVLAIAYRKFNLQVLSEVSLTAVRVISFAILIAMVSVGFVGVFLSLGCGEVLQNLILDVPGGRWGSFAMVMLVIFLLGMFVQWLGILFIVVPIISPLAPALGFDPLWFGLMVCINLQMAFNTPPLAPALFFVRGAAAPELGITFRHIIAGIVPFIILIIVGLVIFTLFPEIILWLPGKMIR